MKIREQERARAVGMSLAVDPPEARREPLEFPPFEAQLWEEEEAHFHRVVLTPSIDLLEGRVHVRAVALEKDGMANSAPDPRCPGPGTEPAGLDDVDHVARMEPYGLAGPDRELRTALRHCATFNVVIPDTPDSVAVMLHEPAPTPVASPFDPVALEIVATLVSVDDHVASWVMSCVVLSE